MFELSGSLVLIVSRHVCHVQDMAHNHLPFMHLSSGIPTYQYRCRAFQRHCQSSIRTDHICINMHLACINIQKNGFCKALYSGAPLFVNIYFVKVGL